MLTCRQYCVLQRSCAARLFRATHAYTSSRDTMGKRRAETNHAGLLCTVSPAHKHKEDTALQSRHLTCAPRQLCQVANAPAQRLTFCKRNAQPVGVRCYSQLATSRQFADLQGGNQSLGTTTGELVLGKAEAHGTGPLLSDSSCVALSELPWWQKSYYGDGRDEVESRYRPSALLACRASASKQMAGPAWLVMNSSSALPAAVPASQWQVLGWPDMRLISCSASMCITAQQ